MNNTNSNKSSSRREAKRDLARAIADHKLHLREHVALTRKVLVERARLKEKKRIRFICREMGVKGTPDVIRTVARILLLALKFDEPRPASTRRHP